MFGPKAKKQGCYVELELISRELVKYKRGFSSGPVFKSYITCFKTLIVVITTLGTVTTFNRVQRK